jgi:hypothetical protein
MGTWELPPDCAETWQRTASLNDRVSWRGIWVNLEIEPYDRDEPIARRRQLTLGQAWPVGGRRPRRNGQGVIDYARWRKTSGNSGCVAPSARHATGRPPRMNYGIFAPRVGDLQGVQVGRPSTT